MTAGLSILRKLKWEHIHLTSYSKMRVDLAAQVCCCQSIYCIIILFTRCFITQVLSNSVAEALALDGDPSTTETQRFVRMFNRFFDLLNVRSLSESIRHRKPDVWPYRDLSDERLKVHNYVNTCISQLASQHFLTVVYSYPSPTFHPFLFLNPLPLMIVMHLFHII